MAKEIIMPLVGIIAKKKDFQAIKREFQNCNIELIYLNKETIKNVTKIFLIFFYTLETLFYLSLL